MGRHYSGTGTGRLRRLLLLALAPACLLTLGFGCIPGSLGFQGVNFLQGMGRQELLREPLRPLRGDPAFAVQALSHEERVLYEDLWASITDSDARQYIERLAASDDLYEYGRLVYTHVSALLMAFRLTGDLRLLDRVDELTQLMRERLDDAWRGSAAVGGEGRDGYLNWAWRASDGSGHFGKDLHETDEMRAHAMIAEVAWAFEANRGVASPAGVDYGERADFWETYLSDHFEPKWRERSGVAWPRFPFLSRPYVHPSLAFAKYNYYRFRLTGRREYLQEAKRLSDLLFAEFREVGTTAGAAYVWMRSIRSLGGRELYLMPTDYSSLVIADALSLHFEGFYGWGDERLLVGIANTVSQFIIDGDASSFGRDIGGGSSRAGIPATSPRDWARVTPSEFSINTFAFLAAWDPTGEIRQVSQVIHGRGFGYPHIPAGLLIDALHDPEPPPADTMGH